MYFLHQFKCLTIKFFVQISHLTFTVTLFIRISNFSSVTQLCLTLYDLMVCSTPGFPVLHHLRSLLMLMTIESVMPSNRLILCHPLLLPSSNLSPASGSFLMSRLFASGGQSIQASASASFLLMNIQDWFPLGLTGLISLKSKGLSRVFFNTTGQKHQFFSIQPSLWSDSHTHT